MYRVSSGFIDHRFLLKTSYWYQVSWFVETLVTCKFFIHWYKVKLKSMSHAYISLACSSLFNEKSSASQLGFYGLQSELTEVLIVDIFLIQRDYLSMSSTQLYAISKLFSSCPLEIIYHIKRLENPKIIEYNIWTQPTTDVHCTICTGTKTACPE